MLDPQSLHKYAYVHGDPVNAVDPTGLMSLSGLGVRIAGFGGMAGSSAGAAARIAGRFAVRYPRTSFIGGASFAGGAISAGEALIFGEEDPGRAFLRGATFAAGFAGASLLFPTAALLIGVPLFGWSVIQPMLDGDYGRATYRAATGLAFMSLGTWYAKTFGPPRETAFRVQGGTPPQASWAYVVVNILGHPRALTERMIWIHFNRQQAIQFRDAQRPGAAVIKFRVDARAVSRIREDAIPQNQASANPGRPQKSDAHYPDAYGLPKAYVDLLIQHAVPRTDGIVSPLPGITYSDE